jgi:chorismate mutase
MCYGLCKLFAMMRGIRGATTVTENTAEAINEATQELLEKMLLDNTLEFEQICSIIFTVTPDLNAAFPAEAARAMGMTLVPLLNALEIPVPGRLERAIRVMMHVETERKQDQIKHIYLRGAVVLRPDIASAQ